MNSNGTNPEKPPLGLMRRNIWQEKCDAARKVDLFNAMNRYSQENQPIPVEWVIEAWEMVDRYFPKAEQ